MNRIAVADLGTNTFNLLIAEKTKNGFAITHTEDRGVRLGADGIENGAMTNAAMERGLQALKGFVEIAKEYGIETVRGTGTSMLRNASNGGEFVSRAKRIGVTIRIIKGNQEAEFICDGVRQAVEFGKRPSLIMDIGGGSVEFILATRESILWKRSFELGTTRLLERIPFSDPLSIQEQLRMEQHVFSSFGPLWAVIDKHHPAMLVGSAGAFDTIAEIVHLRKRPDTHFSDLISSELDLNVLRSICAELLGSTRNERKRMEGLPAYRIDTIIPSMILIDCVLQKGLNRISWSRYSMKEGVAWRSFRSTN